MSVTSCSVFPDQAVLPAESDGGNNAVGGQGAGGAGGGAAGEGRGGQGGTSSRAGAAGDPNLGSAGEGGATGAGGEGGGGVAPGGTGGGSGACLHSRDVALPIDFDTWIDQLEFRQAFADDTALFVRGAPNERRAMLKLTLPAASDALLSATLALHLEANADVSQGARVLGVHQLAQEVGASTTWRNYSNKRWDTEGGDFGGEVARATLPAGTSQGTLAFDVTDLVRDRAASGVTTLSMVILENEAAPASSSELAFTSLEGDASSAPMLLLSYCQP